MVMNNDEEIMIKKDSKEGDHFMPDRKTIRKAARKSLKKHYWFFVAVCLIAGILGTEYANSLQLFRIQKRVQERKEGQTAALGVSSRSGEMSVFNDLVNGDLDSAIASVQHRIDVYQGKDTYIGDLQMGHSDGVLASVINTVTSGALLMTILTTIDTIIGVRSVKGSLLALLGLAVMLLIWVFVTNVYRAAYARVFLEGRIYGKVPFSRTLYLLRLRKHVRASLTMAVSMLLQYLWMFTVIVYPLKRYAYLLVPYLVAENPDLSPMEAIRLSNRMMKGHKWEAFCLELTLLPWMLLSVATGGLFGIFFYHPYKESVFAEYHANIRARFLEEKREGSERLTDRYLFELPEAQVLAEAYPDAVEVANIPQIEVEPRKGFWGFLEKYFGIVPGYDEKEKKCRSQLMLELKKEEYRDTLEQNTYPVRLYPIPAKEKRKKTDDAGFMRHYTIPSVIILFFLICLIGWLWEVVLHLIQAGEFVNRGTLHGPWLPIYGGGCAAILALLYRLRKKPFTQFLMIIVVCGIIEYFSSWLLEVTHDGQRWWDYSGFYLNLNGRICAEGLLVFGIGGVAFIYVLAPWVDNLIIRIRSSVIWGVCIALLAVFLTDVVYSSFVPNTGKGITSSAQLSDQESSGSGKKSMAAGRERRDIADAHQARGAA